MDRLEWLFLLKFDRKFFFGFIPLLDLMDFNGLSVIIALDFLADELTEKRAFLFPLNAFGKTGQLETLCHRGDGLYDALTVLVAVDPVDEFARHFDFIDFDLS